MAKLLGEAILNSAQGTIIPVAVRLEILDPCKSRSLLEGVLIAAIHIVLAVLS